MQSETGQPCGAGRRLRLSYPAKAETRKRTPGSCLGRKRAYSVTHTCRSISCVLCKVAQQGSTKQLSASLAGTCCASRLQSGIQCSEARQACRICTRLEIYDQPPTMLTQPEADMHRGARHYNHTIYKAVCGHEPNPPSLPFFGGYLSAQGCKEIAAYNILRYFTSYNF